ncbi:LuxR C-terminal-related transcriptional regulator, partial [Jatrophihabitans endophyticus]|uniref:helix-turn-helix transcriptional regulator n=1 Tax=Jatrophihabitans endophyticus TaxID=1206085 RepID=UPI001A0FE679
RALTRGAPQAASRYLQRALDEQVDEQDLGPVLADLGTSLLLADRFGEAAEVLRRAHAASRDETELLARTAALWMALTGVGADAVPEGVALLESTIARLQDPESRLMLESEFVNVAFLDPSRLQAVWDRLVPFTALPGDSPAERRLLSMAAVKSQYSASETAAGVADTARRAYRGGLLIDENPLDPTKWIWAVAALIHTDQLDDAEAALHRGAASAAVTGSSQSLLVVEDLRGLLWMRRGRPGDAISEARDALDRLGDTPRTPVVRALEIALVRWSVLAMTARGQLDDAERLLAERGLAGRLPAGPRQIRLHYERGWLRLGQRRHKEALDEALELCEFNREYGIETVVEAPWRTVAARALAALHDTPAAVEMAEEHLALARSWGLPRDVGVALRTRGQIEVDAEQRVALLEASLKALRDAPAPMETAYASTALGAALRRVGRRAEARAVLGDALAGAARCGALGIVERARDELRLVGGHERVRAVSGADSLTPGERRIAALAADGLSNREIAQELFLSVRTAENTLRRVYQKLAITSRRELAAAMSGATGPR